MKALEILKNLQIDVKKDIEAEGIEVFGYIDTAIDEAIAELEAVENILKELIICARNYDKYITDNNLEHTKNFN